MPRPSSNRHFSTLILSLTLLLIASIVISTGMGFIPIEQEETIRIILSKLFSMHDLIKVSDPSSSYIVMEVRLPRILSAALVGASLAVSGVVFQAILLNPLADPYTLGISSGAAFGASLALLINTSLLITLSIPLFAFTGAVLTLFTVIRLSTFENQISAQTLILSGVIVGAILSAGISFLKYIADEQVAALIFWLMGSFASATWSGTALLLSSLLFGLAITLYFSRELNIMSLGQRSSEALGVDTFRIRKILLVNASLQTSVCVALTGIIGFIGLIVPHFMRYLAGPDNRKLIPASALGGGTLLVTADTLTRAILPVEVPIGVLTALIGGPFFCLIFRKKQKGQLQ